MDRSLQVPPSPLQWSLPTTPARRPARRYCRSCTNPPTGATQDPSTTKRRGSGKYSQPAITIWFFRNFLSKLVEQKSKIGVWIMKLLPVELKLNVSCHHQGIAAPKNLQKQNEIQKRNRSKGLIRDSGVLPFTMSLWFLFLICHPPLLSFHICSFHFTSAGQQ